MDNMNSTQNSGSGFKNTKEAFNKTGFSLPDANGPTPSKSDTEILVSEIETVMKNIQNVAR